MDSDKQFFYANAVEIVATPFDFNFKYLRQGTLPNVKAQVGTPPQRIEEFTVAMSPAHAKSMLSVYFKSILDYEKNVGPIALQADTQKLFDDTFGPLLKK